MTSELRRRLLITVGALAGVWLLRSIPLPGVSLATLGDPHDPAVARVRSAYLDQASLGGHGFMPYVSGSMLATLIAFLRAPRRAGPDSRAPGWIPGEPRLALVLSLVFAGIGGCSTGLWLQNPGFPGVTLVRSPGPMFVMTVGATVMGATMLITALAWLISSRGIGNGGVLMLGLSVVEATVVAFRATPTGHTSEDPATWTNPLLLVVGWIALATWWLSLRWTLGESRVDGDARTSGVPRFHVSGVGVIGMGLAVSALRVPSDAAVFLPRDHPFSTWAAGFTPGDPLYLVALVVIGAVVTYAFTAWSNDAALLRRTLRLWPDLARDLAPYTDDRAYDRRLSRAAMLSVLGVPLGCAAFMYLAWHTYAQRLSAISLLILTAVVLDARRQWRSHRAMALGARPGEHDAECGRCGCPVVTSDPCCAGCGVIMAAGDLSCADHSQVPAVARCLVCQRPMCGDCACLVEDRAVCEAHRTVKLVEGWASLGDQVTQLEAEVIQARLEDRKIEAVVLANTWSPYYGTLGMYQVLPAVPWAAHSRCGGGSIHVLVRPTNWIAAMEICRERPEEAAPILTSPVG